MDRISLKQENIMGTNSFDVPFYYVAQVPPADMELERLGNFGSWPPGGNASCIVYVDVSHFTYTVSNCGGVEMRTRAVGGLKFKPSLVD